jgi:hypothetical protein
MAKEARSGTAIRAVFPLQYSTTISRNVKVSEKISCLNTRMNHMIFGNVHAVNWIDLCWTWNQCAFFLHETILRDCFHIMNGREMSLPYCTRSPLFLWCHTIDNSRLQFIGFNSDQFWASGFDDNSSLRISSGVVCTVKLLQSA